MKTSKIETIINILDKEYPESKISLKYKNPFELLIATVLSAQSTDKAVNKITPKLFEMFPDPISLSKVNDLNALIEINRPVGLYNNKSKNLVTMAKSLAENYEGRVPENLPDLLKLDGVGRKTATAVLNNAFNIIEGITVDTHMMRITRKLGWTTVENNNALKIERELMSVIPKSYWKNITHLIIDHGRAICSSKKPQCNKCIIEEYCPSSDKK